MPQVETRAGTIEYGDTEGDGPVLVLLHGLAMDGRLWRKAIPELTPDFRCVTPVLPFGSHRIAMRADADLSLLGIGRIVAELVDGLGLEDATLVFNDWGGAQTMIADGQVGERVTRLVLTSCEAFENYPPGMAGTGAWLAGKLPGGISLMRWTLSRPRLRKLPPLYGQMSKRGVPDELMREWLEPLRRPEIRRDLAKYTAGAMRGKRDMRDATASLASFERPVLVVWDTEGKMMPTEHGRRLADSFPNAELLELDDCYTLIPEDRPEALAAAIRRFVTVPDG